MEQPMDYEDCPALCIAKAIVFIIIAVVLLKVALRFDAPCCMIKNPVIEIKEQIEDKLNELDKTMEEKTPPPPAKELEVLPKAAAELKDLPKAAAELKDLAKAAAELKDLPKAAAELKDLPKAAAELKDLPKATAELKDLPKAAAELKDLPKAAAELKDLPKAAAESKDLPKAAAKNKSVENAKKSAGKVECQCNPSNDEPPVISSKPENNCANCAKNDKTCNHECPKTKK